MLHYQGELQLKVPWRIILITDVERYGRERTLEVIHQVLEAGVKAVLVREKNWMARELHAFSVEVLTMTEKYEASLMVNDRLDVALSSGAHGVHLDDDALHPEAARELARKLDRNDFTIGVQVHNRADVARASAGTADYALFGPVFSSSDEEIFGSPLGVAAMEVICADRWVPILAVGGITPDNVHEAVAAGASGAAFTRAVYESDNPGGIARRFIDAVGGYPT